LVLGHFYFVQVLEAFVVSVEVFAIVGLVLMVLSEVAHK
jgi:hypothetical protein